MERISKYLLALPLSILLLLGCIIPSALVLWMSVYDNGFSPVAYQSVVSGVYLGILVRTATTSLLVALLCVVFGYPVAYYLANSKTKYKTVLLLLIVSPMWVSTLVRTYGWIIVLGREGLVNSLLSTFYIIDKPLPLLYNLFSVLIAMVQVMMPIAIMLMYSSMLNVNYNLVKAARVLGANRVRAFLHVYLPLSVNGAITSGILIFIMSLGFFVVPALVGGPKNQMISNVIVTQVNQTLNWHFGAALGVAIIMIGVVAAYLAFVLSSRFTSDNLTGGVK
ncbi:ABC transporter permease [Brucella pseudogrignonensis]|uniref:ABC transporter permease n=1 Tax=Brucella pseudogrignonensis TaxID=419475 RepID=UPI00124EA81C|nr:ABC transporter permease [Brucella pseudogrignonensis]KAB2689399.1 ABC transporter permease [Brucella pseudogrignonensis]